MLTVFLGLIGLSLVVLVHEFGHFLAARAVGIEVEAFSIGWGPRLFGWKRRGVDWRISALPLGGFCKMKGEEDFKQALEQRLPTIPTASGSFYGASPLRRIAVLVAGPFANVIFAIILFFIVALAGLQITTSPNKIVLSSQFSSLSSQPSDTQPNPADAAGLESGDIIVAIDGKPTKDYSDIQQAIGLNPGKQLAVTVLRDGGRLDLRITPRLDTASGQGYIGIYSWIDPVIASVTPGSPAAIAGLQPNDIIVSVGGAPVRHSLDLLSALNSARGPIDIAYLRNGSEYTATAVIDATDQARPTLGVEFATIQKVERAGSVPQAMAKALDETWNTFATTLKGIGLLFRGVNALKAISGPARITYFVGATAQQSIQASGFAAIPTILSFLAFLSVGLFIMNLLPIPALDGGQILLASVEGIRSRPLSTKFIYRYQFIGAGMMVALLLFATFGDLLFFAGK